MMTNLEVHEMAIDLALADIREAAKDLFDLHPGMREFTVIISDDGHK